MVVVILTACPAGLRGFLTRWLLELSPGVFVGKPTARVRDALWNRVLELTKDGKALMVFADGSEQGLSFRTYRHDWAVEDIDGVFLMRRPHAPTESAVGLRGGWSSAAKYRRARRVKRSGHNAD